MSLPRVRAPGSRVGPWLPPAELGEVPTQAQLDALRVLMTPIGLPPNLLAIAPSRTSSVVWCELRTSEGTKRADYQREDVEALGEAWAADAARRLTA